MLGWSVVNTNTRDKITKLWEKLLTYYFEKLSWDLDHDDKTIIHDNLITTKLAKLCNTTF